MTEANICKLTQITKYSLHLSALCWDKLTQKRNTMTSNLSGNVTFSQKEIVVMISDRDNSLVLINPLTKIK